jgi:HAD superfamily hydrolase (TIGR01484 family)
MIDKKTDFSDWLIASDIDGTPNNKARKLPTRNEDAIKRFVEMGGKFTLASGRNPQSMERHFKKLPIEGTPAIVINGAGLYDFKKDEMICASCRPKNTL